MSVAKKPHKCVKKETSLPIDYSKPLENSKYERFCQEYCIDNNAAQAAIRAGYSPKNANDKGSQLSAIISIKKRIAHLQGKLSEKIGVTPDDITEEFKLIAFRKVSK